MYRNEINKYKFQFIQDRLIYERTRILFFDRNFSFLFGQNPRILILYNQHVTIEEKLDFLQLFIGLQYKKCSCLSVDGKYIGLSFDSEKFNETFRRNFPHKRKKHVATQTND